MQKDKIQYKMGVDAGSTTIKIVILDESSNVIYKIYRRHQANIQGTFTEELNKIAEIFPNAVFKISITGSAGIGIAGEIAYYARKDINKVVCIQPFGCIANHIVAKGIEKRIKEIYTDMNILYLDIDGGIAPVNLQNRLHFMMT